VPLKLCHVVPEECATAIQTLMDHYQFVQNSIRKAELMCTIFRTLSSRPASARRDRLSPAIRYLREHLTEKIDCSSLAQACNLSSAQFYNLFHEEYGRSPLEHRDSLLVDRAVILLHDGAFSVSEVAEMLGFESVSYFSRFFKKHHGVPPSKLQARQQ
jgi:AraC-like DNA-binding protein